MGWIVWLVILIYLISESAKTSRPFATVAAWLITIGAVLVWWGLAPPRSPGAASLGFLLALAGLAFVAVDLAREGRSTEIAIWVPALGAALIGWILVLVTGDEAPKNVRVARGVLGAAFLGVPVALWATVGDFTGLGF